MSDNIVPLRSQSGSQSITTGPKWPAQKAKLKELFTQSTPLTGEQLKIAAEIIFGPAPTLPNPPSFQKGLYFIIGSKGRYLTRAYQRFCAFHLDVFGGDPSRLKSGPGAPNNPWKYGHLVAYRTAYVSWRIKTARQRYQQQAGNLRQKKKVYQVRKIR
jgi:hypothetical protein